MTNAWRAAIAMTPADPETLYVAYGRTNKETGDLGREHTILRTTDGGRTAVQLRGADNVLLGNTASGPLFGPVDLNSYCSQFIYLPNIATGFLAVHPAISTRVFWGLECAVEYDGIHSGFISSADAGNSWQLSWKIGLKQLVVDPRDPATLYAKHQETYARARGHLAKSADGGNEWSIKLSGVLSFALNPHDPSVLLASNEAAACGSPPTGLKAGSSSATGCRSTGWSFIQPNPPLCSRKLLVIRAISSRASDGGATWTVFPTGMDGFSFVFIRTIPTRSTESRRKGSEARLQPPYSSKSGGAIDAVAGLALLLYGETADAVMHVQRRRARLLSLVAPSDQRTSAGWPAR